MRQYRPWIHIEARLWFMRSNHTYHTVRVWVNGKPYTSKQEYGYGDAYRDTTKELLLLENHLYGIEDRLLHIYCKDESVTLTESVIHVPRKKDLHV